MWGLLSFGCESGSVSYDFEVIVFSMPNAAVKVHFCTSRALRFYKTTRRIPEDDPDNSRVEIDNDYGCVLVSALAFYLRGPEFESQPSHWLSRGSLYFQPVLPGKSGRTVKEDGAQSGELISRP
jgi:hypothetical protein